MVRFIHVWGTLFEDFCHGLLEDNIKIRWLEPDGTYRPADSKVPPHNFQENLLLKHGSPAKHS